MCCLGGSQLTDSSPSHASQRPNAISAAPLFFPLRLCECWSIQHAILGHTCLQCLSLSSQPLCPFSHSWPMNTRCSSPFRRYCIHALATSSTSLSSFHPPVLQQRGLRGSQCIFLPSSSCGRMSFHLQFAAGSSSKRRYSLWELHVPANVWSLWPSAWVQVWPGAAGQPVFSPRVMFSTWGVCTLKTDWPAGSVKQ